MTEAPPTPPRSGGPTRKQLAAFIALFTFAGSLLAYFGPNVLNRFEQAIGTQDVPPERPPGVHVDARPFSLGDQVWWWARCRDLGNNRFSCVLWDEYARPVVAGTFEAVTTPSNPGAYVRRPPRLPNPGETLNVGSFHDFDGEISLVRPHGWLVPQGWLYNPFLRTKKRALGPRDSPNRLGDAVPMTAEELKAFTDRGEVP